MGVHILHDSREDSAAFYCSTTDWAFGPVICGNDGHDALERAELFNDWLQTFGKDARLYTDPEMEAKYADFRKLEDELWKAKEKVTDDEQF